jgi:hypothetical protein
MILHYFKNKENKDKKIANFLYLKTIEINSILLIAIFIGSKRKINKD